MSSVIAAVASISSMYPFPTADAAAALCANIRYADDECRSTVAAR